MENFIFCTVLIFSFCLNHSHGKVENSSWENLAWIKKKKKKRKKERKSCQINMEILNVSKGKHRGCDDLLMT